MLELREAWRAKHGPDLKPFHAAVLGCGTVGLERLEAWVLGAHAPGRWRPHKPVARRAAWRG
jgi:uncharacterized protein (DUF885 family)